MKRFYALLIGATIAISSAQASTIVIDLQYLFNDLKPVATAPWARATFTDTGVDTVELKMEALNLFTGATVQTSEFISDWWFNVNPFPSDLDIDYKSGLAASSVGINKDNLKGDGDGYFDILFSFPTSAAAPRFTKSTNSIYTLTGTDLQASSFLALSAAGPGGAGGLTTLAHVQTIGGVSGKSGWITDVPEPATYSLIGLALLAGSWLMRRRMSA